MDVPVAVWIATIAGILALVIFDFAAHIRTPHEPTIREAAIWSAVYVGIAAVFGLGMMAVWSPKHGVEYFSGFLTEYSLSIDNLFVS